MSECHRIYVIVARNIDLPDRKLCMTSGRIASHVAHAVLRMASEYPLGLPLWDQDIIILTAANSADFGPLTDRLSLNEIPFSRYFDTDKLWEGEKLTAICTFPILRERGSVLSDLRPWKCACNEGAK